MPLIDPLPVRLARACDGAAVPFTLLARAYDRPLPWSLLLLPVISAGVSFLTGAFSPICAALYPTERTSVAFSSH
jgi:hypothetical protein